MDRTTTKRLLREQILDIWGQGRVDLVDANYRQDVADRMPIPGQSQGREPLKDVVTAFRAGLPDLRMTLHAAIASGDLGVDVWTLEATHAGSLFGEPATGRPVRFCGIDMVRVENGQIAELWHVEEMLHLRQQIGLTAGCFGAPAGAQLPDPVHEESYEPGRSALTPDHALLSHVEKRTLAVARTHIEEMWAKGRSELAETLYDPGVIDHNPAPDQRPGIAGIVDVLHWLREAAPDLRMRIEAYVVENDVAADRWVMTGTHTGAPLMGVPATGKAFRINGMDVIRVNDTGKITDVWHVEEFASLLSQIS